MDRPGAESESSGGLREAFRASLMLEALKHAERALAEGRANDALTTIRLAIGQAKPKDAA